VIANWAAADYFRTHFRVADVDDAQLDGSIGQQYAVARFYVGGEVGVSGGGAAAIAQKEFRCDREGGPDVEHAAAARKAAETDFGPLQIEHDANRTAQFRGGPADFRNARGVLCLRAVRRVQAEHIHAGQQELLDNGRGIAGGPQGGDDLGIGHTPLCPSAVQALG
jgi:hypothetical protein